MNRFLCSVFLGLIFVPNLVSAWGFWAHTRINRHAVLTLPPELLKFYKLNINYITEQAVVPDKRRHVLKEEASRHYIDIDRYGTYPFDSLPRKWDDAVAKYSADTLNKHGIVVWHIQRMMKQLTEAFRKKDTKLILKLSAELGHYLADAHVPLHASTNYDGQLTDQKGIHALWESRLPELFGENYDFYVGKATYLRDIEGETWKTILESAAAVDSVLTLEKEVSKEFKDKKHSFETRGTRTVKVYTKEFCEAYNKRLNGMVERRLRTAIHRIGCFLVTAWRNAKKPRLAAEDLDLKPDNPQADPQKKTGDDREGNNGGPSRPNAVLMPQGVDKQKHSCDEHE